jgi:hypothetical protein
MSGSRAAAHAPNPAVSRLRMQIGGVVDTAARVQPVRTFSRHARDNSFFARRQKAYLNFELKDRDRRRPRHFVPCLTAEFNRRMLR